MRPLFLDTDIGDDVDDLLAVAIACASPELSLKGVGTVFGPAARRTVVARSVLTMAGSTAPVFIGSGLPLTPPERNPEFAEVIRKRFDPHEGISLHVDLGLPEEDLPPPGEAPASEAMARFWSEHPKGRTVAIGPLTNLATAVSRAASRPDLTVMAGRFERDDWAEWNVKCDPDAAAIVFESDCEIDVIPYEIGVAMSFTEDEVRQFTGLATPLSDLIRDAIERWRGQGFGFHVWDLLAVLASARPELFEWKSGTVRVETSRDRYGFTAFLEKPYGRHRIAVSGNREAIVPAMIDRLVTSCTRALRGR